MTKKIVYDVSYSGQFWTIPIALNMCDDDG